MPHSQAAVLEGAEYIEGLFIEKITHLCIKKVASEAFVGEGRREVRASVKKASSSVSKSLAQF